MDTQNGLQVYWALFLIGLVGTTRGLGPDQLVFKLGAVLPPHSRSQDLELGYRLLEEFRVEDTWKITWRDGSQTKVYFQYVQQQSESLENHEEGVRKLLESREVDFLLGSVEMYSDIEAEVAAEMNGVNLQCCSTPVRFKQMKGVYWLKPLEKNFVDPVIRNILLEGIKKMAVVYDSEDAVAYKFCATTLHKLLKEFREVDNEVDFSTTLAYNSSNEIEMFQDLVNHFREEKIEALVACCQESSCGNLLNSIHQQKYPLKSLYLMKGPSDRQWVEKFPLQYTRDILSTTPWSVRARIADELFGNLWKYRNSHKKFYNTDDEPGYDSTSAFSAGIVALSAIKTAFAPCNLTLGVDAIASTILGSSAALSCDDTLEKSGYERIASALDNLDIVTPVGEVSFDRKQRNRKTSYITTQVRKQTSMLQEETFSIDVVLPIQYATAQMKIPATNPYLVTCKPGQYATSDEFDRCRDCPPGEVSARIDANHCDRCSFTEWMSDPGQQVCNQCPSGTRVLERGATNLTDCLCIPNYYQPESKPGVQCFPCMKGAECPGGLELPFPQKGYWASTVARQSVYDCNPESSCDGGLEFKCARGYDGRLCASCVEGYFHLLDKCWTCPSTMRLIGLILLIVVLWYFVNVVVSKNFDTFDMVLAFSQLGNIISDVDLNWPSKLVHVFGVTNILDFDVDVLEPTCIFKNWGFAQNLYVQLSLPLLMGLIAIVGFLISWATMHISKWLTPTKRRTQTHWLAHIMTIPDTKEKLSEKWDGTIAAFLSAIDVTFVTISKYCLDTFQCELIGNKMVLRNSPSVECGTKDHTTMRIFAALGIVVYVIFYSGFVSWKLLSMWRARTFADPRNLRRFGSFYRCFEPDYFWMSPVYIARRLAFVMIIVFVKSPAFQAGALTTITNGSLMLHVYTAPYVSTRLDILFSFLLVALMFQTFGGLMFYTEKITSVETDFLESLVIIAIISLVLAFIILFAQEVVQVFRVIMLRKMHQRATHIDEDCESSHGHHRSSSSTSKDLEISFELLKTFNPRFLYKALSKSKTNLGQWNRFTLMLKDYVSDQSETSYLSTHNIAKFWRDLVERFPELVDYLALTDSKGRHHFAEFANKLYINHYLCKHVEDIQIFKVLHWRDRAPLAQWLAHCSEEDREFFTSFMGDMFRTANGEENFNTYKQKVVSRGEFFPDSSESNSKNLQEEGAFPNAISTLLALMSGVHNIRSKLTLKGQIAIREEIRSARGPLFHCASQVSNAGPSENNSWVAQLQGVDNAVHPHDSSSTPGLVPVVENKQESQSVA